MEDPDRPWRIEPWQREWLRAAFAGHRIEVGWRRPAAGPCRRCGWTSTGRPPTLRARVAGLARGDRAGWWPFPDCAVCVALDRVARGAAGVVADGREAARGARTARWGEARWHLETVIDGTWWTAGAARRAVRGSREEHRRWRRHRARVARERFPWPWAAGRGPVQPAELGPWWFPEPAEHPRSGFDRARERVAGVVRGWVPARWAVEPAELGWPGHRRGHEAVRVFIDEPVWSSPGAGGVGGPPVGGERGRVRSARVRAGLRWVAQRVGARRHGHGGSPVAARGPVEPDELGPDRRDGVGLFQVAGSGHGWSGGGPHGAWLVPARRGSRPECVAGPALGLPDSIDAALRYHRNRYARWPGRRPDRWTWSRLDGDAAGAAAAGGCEVPVDPGVLDDGGGDPPTPGPRDQLGP